MVATDWAGSLATGKANGPASAATSRPPPFSTSSASSAPRALAASSAVQEYTRPSSVSAQSCPSVAVAIWITLPSICTVIAFLTPEIGATALLLGLPAGLTVWCAWMAKQPAMPTSTTHMRTNPITVAVWYASECSPAKPEAACWRIAISATSCWWVVSHLSLQALSFLEQSATHSSSFIPTSSTVISLFASNHCAWSAGEHWYM
mmetsp:Transcript_3253/g.8083  ORF Transcript_3253/g.8083 Transcript_3253/m.8083 type:complete len:205 (+) Transcript_3253:399-1013(+)